MFGEATPKLQVIIMNILKQVVCAFSCEQNCSTFNFIQFKKGIHLTLIMIYDFIFLFNNIQFKSKVLEGQIKMKRYVKFMHLSKVAISLKYFCFKIPLNFMDSQVVIIFV
jgi:hypothetical protein